MKNMKNELHGKMMDKIFYLIREQDKWKFNGKINNEIARQVYRQVIRQVRNHIENSINSE